MDDKIKEVLTSQFSERGAGPIAKEFGLSYPTVRRYAVSLGLVRDRPYSKETNTEWNRMVSETYAKEGAKSLALKLGVSESAIASRAFRMGIKKRVFENLDDVLRDGISTEEEAYFVGYTMADGCVFIKEGTSKSSRKCSVSWGIQARDIELMNWVSRFLRLGRVPKVDNTCRESVFPGGGGCKSGPRASVWVTNYGLVERLGVLGVVPRKSGKECIPSMPPEFVSSFLRGYFDGDGSISWKLGHYRSLSFWGGLEFCKGVSAFFARFGVTPKGPRVLKNSSVVCTVTWSKACDIEKISNILYPRGVETAPALGRKKIKVLECVASFVIK